MEGPSSDAAHTPQRSDAVATRIRILRAAESLFASSGIDGVSLQQIGRVADQKNRSAVQYHFANKEGLLLAILDRHTPSITEHRNELIDQIEQSGRTKDVRRLAEAFVLPVAHEARNPDGGLAFIRICAQLIGHPRYGLFRLDEIRGRTGSRRLMRLARAASRPLSPEQALPRWITITGLVFHGIADWSQVVDESDLDQASEAWHALVDHLVDATSALLGS